jgi:hypothetical protein
MGLVSCIDCGNRISNAAPACIHCGRPSPGAGTSAALRKELATNPAVNLTSGFLYVLVNPSMAGLVKVGRTDRDPASRARELSAATGVPTPFILVFEAAFPDSSEAERFVHSWLTERGFRLLATREFFNAPPGDAIRAVLEAQRVLGQVGAATPMPAEEAWESEGRDWSYDEDSERSSDDAPFSAVFKAADQAELGYIEYDDDDDDDGGDDDDDYEARPVDKTEALDLYNQAAALGSIAAWKRMARIYDGQPLWDAQRALACYQEGAIRGDGECFALMSDIYVRWNQFEKATKCWKRYFGSYHFKGRRNGIGRCAVAYVNQVREYKLPFAHREEIMQPQIQNAMKAIIKDLSFIEHL